VFAVTYAGQICGQAGSPATATMCIKGSGYTVDGTGGATATLNYISLKFVGQPGPNPLNTNQTKIVGQLTGSIRGKTPLAPLQTTLPALQAVITRSSVTSVSIATSVAQSQLRMLLFDNGFSGSGLVGSTGAYRFNEVGIGANQGATFLVFGALGSYTNKIGPNQVSFFAPVSAQFKGKIKGQVVWGAVDAGQINAALVH
jgi:hypothetical protein